MEEYVAGAELGADPNGPLFRSAGGATWQRPAQAAAVAAKKRQGDDKAPRPGGGAPVSDLCTQLPGNGHYRISPSWGNAGDGGADCRARIDQDHPAL